MGLIVDQSLAAGFIPINTQQQLASLPFKPDCLQVKMGSLSVTEDLRRYITMNDDINDMNILSAVKVIFHTIRNCS